MPQNNKTKQKSSKWFETQNYKIKNRQKKSIWV